MYANKSYLVDVDPQDSTDIPKFKILENTQSDGAGVGTLGSNFSRFQKW